MKKKICYFVVIFLMVFLATGCKNGEITRGIRHAGFTVSETEFTCSEFLPKDEEDTTYAKIWYYNGSQIITESGIIYDVSLDMPFANGESCKQADFTKKVVAILDDKIIKADDNKLYYFSSNGNLAAFSEVPTDDNSYQVYQIIFKDPDVIKAITVDQNSGIYYVLKRDGNVYKMVITRSEYNQPYVLRSSEIFYSKGVYGIILDFNYSADAKGNYIRTNTTIHRNIASNSDECNKYADVICQYQMREDTELELYLDRIVAYNGTTLITDYGKIFTVN